MRMEKQEYKKTMLAIFTAEFLAVCILMYFYLQLVQ